MIKKFHLFERQLQLFNLPKTDKDVVHQLITKHQTKPVKKGNKLLDDLSRWTDKDVINQKIYDYLGELDCMSGDFVNLLYHNQNILIDYIEEKPENISKQYKCPEEIIKIIKGDDDWYYHVEEYIENVNDFSSYFLNSVKDDLYNLHDLVYLDSLENAIYDSKDPYRLKIYRAITLPQNLEKLDNYSGVGVYWTYDKEKAEAYWSEHDREFILEGLVYSNGINWDETVYKSIYAMGEEKEILLYDDASVMLTSVYMESIYNDFREINLVIEEEERIRKLFGLNHEQISNFLINKHKKMSEIVFDEPFWVKT